ncbi:unnamed protein product, partial [Nesidiocoris tenuis]
MVLRAEACKGTFSCSVTSALPNFQNPNSTKRLEATSLYWRPESHPSPRVCNEP